MIARDPAISRRDFGFPIVDGNLVVGNEDFVSFAAKALAIESSATTTLSPGRIHAAKTSSTIACSGFRMGIGKPTLASARPVASKPSATQVGAWRCA